MSPPGAGASGAGRPAADAVEWRLLGQTPGGAVAELRLRPGGVKTIGRAAFAGLVVDAPLLSRVHCRITAHADRLEVEDLRSTNGTFVNGKRVERAALRESDRLTIGRVDFAISRRAPDAG